MPSRTARAQYRPGQLLDIEAGPLASDGSTRTPLDGGLELRLNDAIPGEQHRVRIVHRSRGGPVIWGESISLLGGPESGNLRRKPPCPIHRKCGSCGLQHVRDNAQLRLKVESAASYLSAELRAALDPPSSWPEPGPFFGYRHKAIFLPQTTKGKLKLGGFRRRSHEVIDLPDCSVLTPALVQAHHQLSAMLTALARDSSISFTPPGAAQSGASTAGLRALVLRANRAGEVLLCAVVTQPTAGQALQAMLTSLVSCAGPIVGCSLQVFAETGDRVAGPESPKHIAGKGQLMETVSGMEAQLDALSFFQVNPHGLEAVIEHLLGWTPAHPEQPTRLLELYCGGGVLGLAMATARGGSLEVYGVDNDSRAIDRARHNAARNKLKATYRVGSSSELVGPMVQEYGPFDLTLVDPPRRGLRPQALKALLLSAPRRIMYVSCYGPSLVRDATQITASGYRIRSLSPLDMLPQTPHLEWTCIFDRQLS